MGLSLSLILAAGGAILIWAVDASVSGVNLDVVGIILLIVGIVNGALLSLAFWSSWGALAELSTPRSSTTVAANSWETSAKRLLTGSRFSWTGLLLPLVPTTERPTYPVDPGWKTEP